MGDQLGVILLVISNQSQLLIWPISNYLSDDFLSCTALSPMTITYYILPIGYKSSYAALSCKFIEITSLFFMAFSFIFKSDNET